MADVWTARNDGSQIMHYGAFSAIITRKPSTKSWQTHMTFGGFTEKTETLCDGRDEPLDQLKLDARQKLRRWLQNMIDYAPHAARLMDE